MSLFKKQQATTAETSNIDDREKRLQKDRDNLEHDKMLFELEKEYFQAKSGYTIGLLEDKAKGEHDYHTEESEKKTTLKLLDKEIEFKEKYKDTEVELQTSRREKSVLIEKFTAIISEKDSSIERLDGMVKVLITKLPNVDLKNMNFNIGDNK